MRSYCIDELTTDDLETLRRRLDEMELGSGMEGLFWLPVPPSMLTQVQEEHLDECGPYSIALELTDGALRMELLVRARNRLRCECIGYASVDLERHGIDYVDTMLRDLGIAI